MCHTLRVKELRDLEHWLSVQRQVQDRLREGGSVPAGTTLVTELLRSTAQIGLEHLEAVRELLEEELARDLVGPWCSARKETEEAGFVLGAN
jgi:hypothetical protein